MRYWNTYEIEDAATRFMRGNTPNLMRGVLVLARLANWANANSDGWAYWPKPARAANKLMELMESVDRWEPEDVTAAQLRQACAPIKAFLTRQGVAHDVIFGIDTTVGV